MADEDLGDASDGGLQALRARLVRLLHLRHLGIDHDLIRRVAPSPNKIDRYYRPNEARTAAFLEHHTGKRLERSDKDQRGDWRDTRTGRIYDDCSPGPSKYFDRQFENWVDRLNEHLDRYDVVSVDLRYRDLTRDQISRVVWVLNALPPARRKKIIIIVDADT